MTGALPDLDFPAVVLAREAMATRFELVLPGANSPALRAAGEEALDEVERVESQLSLFRPTSEIAHTNARAAREPVRLSEPVFRLLQHAQRLSRETAGAFDITVAPLAHCWGFLRGDGRLPTPDVIAQARRSVGLDGLELNEAGRTIRFHRPGMMLDLGAIGKGHAIDCAVDILRSAGITSALIHGGTSSIFALGRPPNAEAWKVAIEARALEPGGDSVPLAVVWLEDESLSVSAVWGKQLQAGGKTYGHVIDPRTGWPADGAQLAAIILPSATEADALTTALLIDGKQHYDRLANLRPGMKSLVSWTDQARRWKTVAKGIKVS